VGKAEPVYLDHSCLSREMDSANSMNHCKDNESNHNESHP
jgi:hypothetical protein